MTELLNKNGTVRNEFQPPAKIGGVHVDYNNNSIAEFRGKFYVTLFPLDEEDDRLWEFCLDDGKIMVTK